MRPDLTAHDLRELLHYDPETGVFTWRRSTGPKKAGAVAGFVGNRGYVIITIKRRHYLAHRLAWLYVHGEWPTGEVDHRFGGRADNRIGRLRDVTRLVNNQNQRRPRSDSTTGFLGVTRDRRPLAKPFKAQIRTNRKCRKLGYFATAQEASDAYLAAKRHLHAGCTL